MDMEKYTFSQVISTLVEIEQGLAQFYEHLSKEVKDKTLKELVSEAVQESLARAESLNRVRQLTVTEFSLEPITGLNLEHYTLQINMIREEDPYSLDKAVELEDTLQKLYQEASARILSASPDASELLVQFSRESRKRKLKLTSHRGMGAKLPKPSPGNNSMFKKTMNFK
jgi:translation initiation factor RLI1